MTEFPVAVDPPTANITDSMFVDRPLHWLDLAVRGLRFRITRDGRPMAMLIPIEVNPEGIGEPE